MISTNKAEPRQKNTISGEQIVTQDMFVFKYVLVLHTPTFAIHTHP